MWDLIVSVPDHCLSFYFNVIKVSVDRNNHFHFGLRPLDLEGLGYI